MMKKILMDCGRELADGQEIVITAFGILECPPCRYGDFLKSHDGLQGASAILKAEFISRFDALNVAVPDNVFRNLLNFDCDILSI